MNRNIIYGIAIVAIVVGGLYFTGFINIPESTNANMDITFYDEEGNKLGQASTSGLSMFGIRGAGIEGDIHSLEIVVYFTITTDIEYTSILSTCFLEVETTVNTIIGERAYLLEKHQLGAVNTDLSGTFYRGLDKRYLMSELLPESAIDQVGKDKGWNMHFMVSIETVLTLLDGTTREIRDTCGLNLTLIWDEHLELESYVVIVP